MKRRMFVAKNNQQPSKKREKGELNIFSLLLVVLIVAFIATFIIPSGQFERTDLDGRTVIVDGSFEYTDADNLGFINLLSSIPQGLQDTAGIIFFVLIIGGAFGILNATGTTQALIMALTKKLGNNEKWIIPILMLYFGLSGALIGAYEEMLPYVVILAPLVLALGFDTMTGVAIVYVGVATGFMSAIMNPFTIGVAQKIAELPLYSGMGFRIIVFIVFYIIGVTYVYRHAMKVKKDPSKGIYGSMEVKSKEEILASAIKLETRHKIILGLFVLNLIIIAFGVVKMGWYFNEIAGMFVLFGLVVGFVGKLNAKDITDEFFKGAATILQGALIIGLARAIVVVLDQGQIMDTILYGIANLISALPSSVTAVGMLFVQTLISFIVPSGSGMASLTMPIMSPLADMVDVSRQTAVLAYQLGDGISNLVVPGVAVAAVGLVGISYVKWVKWLFPLLCIQFVTAAILIIIANAINYGPF